MMKKDGKRYSPLFLALILALIAVVCIAPMAFGADVVATDTYGSCTWKLNSEGVLTISPTTGDEGTLGNPSNALSWTWNPYREQVKSVEFTGTVKANSSLYGMFYGMKFLQSADLSGFETAAATDMTMMFQGCENITALDLSGFNTANVTTFEQMFSGCSKLETITFDPTKFTTANALSLRAMFQKCAMLQTVAVGAWNTANVKDMSYMFNGCERIDDLDVSQWKTGSVTKNLGYSVSGMAYMFAECASLKALDVSGWKTDDVAHLQYMFDHCRSLETLNVSSWNVAKVENMDHMFNYCEKLTGLDLTSWNTPRVENMEFMFGRCFELEELDLSSIDTRNVTRMGSLFSQTPHLKRVTFGDNFAMKGYNITSGSYMGKLEEHTAKTNGTGWTGKWVRLDDGAILSVNQIQALDYAELTGTYVWEGQITFTKVDQDDRPMGNVEFSLDGDLKTTGSNGKFVVDGVYEDAVTGKVFTLTETTPEGYEPRGPWDLTVTTDRVATPNGSPVDGWKLVANLDGTPTTTIENAKLQHTLTYTVVNGTWDDDGSTTLTKTVNHGDPAPVPTATAAQGYEGGDWDTDPATVTSVEGDQTFTLTFARKTHAIVTFNSNGGTPVGPQTVALNTAVAEPESPTRDGYAFAGWFNEAVPATEPYNFETPVTDDITLTAHWTWADGKIKLEFGWVKPDNYRNSWQHPSAGNISWFGAPYYIGGAAKLFDATGKEVASYTNESRHTFTDLPAGTYTIQLSVLDGGIYHIVPGVVNGGPISHLITEYESEVEIVEGNTSEILRWVMLEYKAYGLKTKTTIGAFATGDAGDETTKTYYTGRNWSFDNPDPSTNTSWPTFNTHDGIYYNDSPSQYSGMNTLEIPSLSPDEAALGYKFAGWHWTEDPEGVLMTTAEALAIKVEKDIVLEAVFELPQHKLTFKTDTDKGLISGGDEASPGGDKATVTINGNLSPEGAQKSLPTVTEKAGYQFIGWYTDPVTTNVIPLDAIKDTVVTEDTTYYAKYREVYDVTWKNGDTELEKDENVAAGTEPSFDGATPTKAADDAYTYTFMGWSKNANSTFGLPVEFLPEVTKDVTYHAIFRAIPKDAPAPTYTVTWQNGTTELEKDENVAANTAPAYDGTTPTKAEDNDNTYVFLGWSKNAAATAGLAAEDLPKVTEDVTYHAIFRAIPKDAPTPTYTVTWQNGTTELEKDENVAVGTAPAYDGTTPTKAEDNDNTYVFLGWSKNANATAGLAMEDLPKVTEDVTYHAIFRAIPKDAPAPTYTVTWQNGTTELEKDENVAANTAPVYDGATPTKAEDNDNTYVFLGWSKNAAATAGLAMEDLPKVTEDVTYHAIFRAIPKDAPTPTYTVTWKNGVTLETDTDVPANAAPEYNGSIPTKPSEAGYVYDFIGWSTDPDALTGLAAADLPKVTENVTYHAVFQGRYERVRVFFNPNGGMAESYVNYSQEMQYGGKAQALTYNPTREGYTFLGWFVNDRSFDFNEPIYHDTIVTAEWEKLKPAVTVKFDFGDNGSQAADDTTPTEQTIAPGEKAQSPRVTPKEGFVFKGWTIQGLEGVVFTEAAFPNLPLDNDVTFTAVYEEEQTEPVYDDINVTFTIGENGKQTDTTPTAQTIPGNTAPTSPKLEANSGYTFLGWEIEGGDGTIYSPAAVNKMLLTEDTAFIARYQPNGGGDKPGLSILHYESNGGTGYNDEFYRDGTNVNVDKKPTRSGYTFTGWFKDKDLKQPVTSFTMNGDITVYAGWKKNDPVKPDVPDELNGDDHFAYVIGYPDGKVHPEGKVTRAEVATIFFRLLKDGVRDANFTRDNNFSDVKAGQWHNSAISTMAKMGIVNGYKDGTFKPNNPITRAEFAAIAARFDKKTQPGPTKFTDIATHWAKNDISKAAARGWVTGYPDNTFRPNQSITRAETMAIVNRVLVRDPAAPEDLLATMVKWPDNANTKAWFYLDVQEATNSHYYERETKGTEVWTEIRANRDWSQLQ